MVVLAVLWWAGHPAVAAPAAVASVGAGAGSLVIASKALVVSARPSTGWRLVSETTTLFPSGTLGVPLGMPVSCDAAWPPGRRPVCAQ